MKEAVAAAAAVFTTKRPSIDTYRGSTINYGDTTSITSPPHHVYQLKKCLFV